MNDHIAGLREALEHAQTMETYYRGELMKLAAWEALLDSDNATIVAEAKGRTSELGRLRESAEARARQASALIWAPSELAPESVAVAA